MAGESFLSLWSSKFISSAANPTATDIIAAGLSAFSGGVAPLAKEGLVGEAAEEAARQADLIVGGSGNVPGIAVGGAQDGMSGLMREVAGAAFGTAAGWVGGGLAAAAVVALLPEAAVAAVVVGAVAAVASSYLEGKEI
jgi:hypothetical protein